MHHDACNQTEAGEYILRQASISQMIVYQLAAFEAESVPPRLRLPPVDRRQPISRRRNKTNAILLLAKHLGENPPRATRMVIAGNHGHSSVRPRLQKHG